MPFSKSPFDRAQYALIIAIVFVLAAIGAMQVFSRYVLGSAYAWTEELSRFLLIWLVMLAAAVEIHRGGHICLTMLVERFSLKSRRRLDQAALMFIFGFGIIVTIYGYQLVTRTMSQSASTLPISIGAVYMALPVGGVLMALNAARRFFWGGPDDASAAASSEAA